MLSSLSKLAFDLCSISSISYQEHEVLDYTCSVLENSGFIIKKIPVANTSRFNIFAYFQDKPVYSAIFCTHLDTVAPFIAPQIDEQDKILWGRGSCDAKGIAASMIMALIEQKKKGYTDLALLLTVGEEESSDGAKACQEALKGRANILVVGEPTELKAAFAQKGSLVFDLKASGISAHSAMPELGDSAINKLITSLNKLISTPWPKDEVFGETYINIGLINGGSMRNILASSAEARGIMRTSVPTDLIEPLLKASLSTGIELSITSSTDPFSYVVPAGFPSFLAGFGSDAPYLRQIGKPMLIGPGSLSHAHKESEHITLRDLEDGLKAYEQIAQETRINY